jgi:predicted MPP superfamily phosphohydrolase
MNIFELAAVGLFIGVVLIAFACGFIVIIVKRRVKPKPGHKPDILDRHPVRYAIIGFVVIGTACILYGYLIEPNRIEVTHLRLISSKAGGGDKAVRIVHISDLHIESEGRRELLAPEMINSQNPQIIILTGDYLNSPDGRPYLANFLSKLKASYGIYAVTGNFEVGYLKSDDIFAQQNIILGNPSAVSDKGALQPRILGSKSFLQLPKYNDSINIDALNIALYLRNLHNPIMPEGIDPKRYNIFVYHTPDLIPEAAAVGFDLYLCGHTHGGQVRLPFYGALITFSKYGKRYEMGYYREGNMDAYVNRGLGMEGGVAPRVRFLARPEIAVIDIVKPE